LDFLSFYLDSAVSYEQVDSPPDKAADVARSLATGSALLPHATNPKSLVADFGHGDSMQRIEILFSRRLNEG
jgi:hypothetical protein